MTTETVAHENGAQSQPNTHHDTAVQPAIDETRLQQFMGTLIGYMTGAAACFGIWLGDELGLYRALANAGALTANALADKTSCNPRLVREWLDGQAAGK